MGNARFAGKVALITGGGTGIGAAVAREISAGGGKVVLTGRRPQPIERIADEVGGAAIAGDTSDPAHLEEAVALAVARFGGLDILVANAGVEHLARVEDMDLANWHQTMAVNVDGPMLASRASIAEMRRRGGGSIVLVASMAALVAVPAGAAYMTTKAALLGLNRSLAMDYGPEGIRCNIVCPALVPSEMTHRTMAMVAAFKGMEPDELTARIGHVYPLRRLGKPEEIAKAIGFLASDDASFITGVVLAADGGAGIVDVATLA